MSFYLFKDADISNCGKYRFSLYREWNSSLPTVTFIGLNPSTADAENDDNTIRRCRNFANSWGYGSLIMVNLFAYRASNPGDLEQADFPVGKDNDTAIKTAVSKSELTICCWGRRGHLNDRDSSVLIILREFTPLYCLKINYDGSPSHPLYLSSTLEPELFLK